MNTPNLNIIDILIISAMVSRALDVMGDAGG